MRKQHHTQRRQWGRRAATVAVFLGLGFVLNLAVAWGSLGGLRAGWLRSLNTTPRVQLGNEMVGPRFIFINCVDTLLLSRVVVQSQQMVRPIDLQRDRQASRVTGGPVIGDARAIMPSWTRWNIDEAGSDAMPIVLPQRARATTKRHLLPVEVVPDEINREFVAVGLPFRSNLNSKTDPRVRLPTGVWLSQFSEVANPSAPVFTFWPPSVSLGGEGYPLRPIWPGTLLNTALFAALLFALSRIPIALRRRRRRRRNQ
jgi:hypothetical protein